MSIDYREQVVISSIKLDVKFFIYQVHPKKRENLGRT